MIKAGMPLGDDNITFFFNVDSRREKLFEEMDYMNFGELWVSMSHFTPLLDYLYKPYDYALPQGFFDEYQKEHGERPKGIWCYQNDIWGHFVHRDEIMEKIGEYVIGKFKAGKFEMVEV